MLLTLIFANLLQPGRENKGQASTSLSVVRISSADGIGIEGSFQEGVKKETLRSLCQVANGTQLTLEVALADLGDDWHEVASDSFSYSKSAASSRSVALGTDQDRPAPKVRAFPTIFFRCLESF